jgi:hypothetical protein
MFCYNSSLHIQRKETSGYNVNVHVTYRVYEEQQGCWRLHAFICVAESQLFNIVINASTTSTRQTRDETNQCFS